MSVTLEQLDAAFDATIAEFDTNIFRDCWAAMRKRLVAADTEQQRQTAEWQAEFRRLGEQRRQQKGQHTA